MTILICCPSCNIFYSRKNASCPKCNVSLKSIKKFKVNVKKPDGKRLTRTFEGSLSLAKNIENKLKGDIAQEKHLGIKKAPEISSVWKKYLDWAMKNKKSWKTDQFLWEKHVKEILKSKPMDSIYPNDIQNLLDIMRNKKKKNGGSYAPQTIKLVLVLIKRVYNWAIDLEMYNGPNPAAKVKPPKVNNQVTECLTKNELSRLSSVLEEWENKLGALVVKFALFTGLRLDEVLGLEWERVDLEKSFILLPDPKGKPVNLPLNNEALEIVSEANEHMPVSDCQWVFPNNKGERRVSFSRIWQRIKKKADLPKKFRFHGLRHTFASYLASSGKVDLYTLQKLLNHQTPQMTQRYAHLLDGALRRGADVADEVFSNDYK